MVPPTSQRIPRVRRYSGYCRSPSYFAYMTLTFFGWLSHAIQLYFSVTCAVHYPECITTLGLASSAFARHYSRNLGWFLFLSLLRCFSSGGSPRNAMDSRYVPLVLHQGGFPIRKSADIMLICSSPQLIAACHVLHRLLMPRHSPCALFRLNFPIR